MSRAQIAAELSIVIPTLGRACLRDSVRAIATGSMKPGAIVLSSLVWTALHLQYNWYFLGEVFSIGLLLGYLRYRSHSIWLTIILHGLNNLAAVVQTILLTGS